MITPFLFLSICINCHLATFSSSVSSAFFPSNRNASEIRSLPTNELVKKSIALCKNFRFSFGGHLIHGLSSSDCAGLNKVSVVGEWSFCNWFLIRVIEVSRPLAKQFGWAGICTEVFSIGTPVVGSTHQQNVPVLWVAYSIKRWMY